MKSKLIRLWDWGGGSFLVLRSQSFIKLCRKIKKKKRTWRTMEKFHKMKFNFNRILFFFINIIYSQFRRCCIFKEAGATRFWRWGERTRNLETAAATTFAMLRRIDWLFGLRVQSERDKFYYQGYEGWGS